MTPSFRHHLDAFRSRRRGRVRRGTEAQALAARGGAVTRPVAVRSQVVGVVLQGIHQFCLHVMEGNCQVRAALRALRTEKTGRNKNSDKNKYFKKYIFCVFQIDTLQSIKFEKGKKEMAKLGDLKIGLLIN